MNPFAPRWLKAPGKLMWIGEYAVLDGAPALVSAVNRYGALRWETTTGGPDDLTLTLRSTLSDEAWILRDAQGALAAETPAIWRLAKACAEVIREKGFALIDQGGDLFISTNALSGDEVKLGLGSSAAVAALMTAALVSGPLDDATCYALALDAHRRFQGGVGSGADVAASALGGLLRVQAGEAPRPIKPPSLKLAIVHTGVEANTREMIRALKEARAARPAVDKLLAAMGECSSAALDALEREDNKGFLDEVRAFHQLEVELSAESGVGIVTDEISAAVNLIAQCDGAAKASGAGGGDIVVGFFEDDARRDRMIDMSTNAGLTALRIEIEPAGVLELSKRPQDRSARREHR